MDYDYNTKPSCVMLHNNVTDGQTKWMYFLLEDNNLLEKYNTIWDKASADIKKNLMADLFTIKFFWKSK